MEPVGPAAVERTALVIDIGSRRLRAETGRQSRRHGRADTCSREEQANTRIEEARSVAQEFVAPADEWRDEVCVFEQVLVGYATLIRECARRRVPDRSGMLEEL